MPSLLTDFFIWELLSKVAGVKGLEPSTYRVTGDRSNQLSYTPTYDSFWWAVKDSNLWPPRCKRDALPAELTALNQKHCVLYLLVQQRQVQLLNKNRLKNYFFTIKLNPLHCLWFFSLLDSLSNKIFIFVFSI